MAIRQIYPSSYIATVSISECLVGSFQTENSYSFFVPAIHNAFRSTYMHSYCSTVNFKCHLCYVYIISPHIHTVSLSHL